MNQSAQHVTVVCSHCHTDDMLEEINTMEVLIAVEAWVWDQEVGRPVPAAWGAQRDIAETIESMQVFWCGYCNKELPASQLEVVDGPTPAPDADPDDNLAED